MNSKCLGNEVRIKITNFEASKIDSECFTWRWRFSSAFHVGIEISDRKVPLMGKVFSRFSTRVVTGRNSIFGTPLLLPSFRLFRKCSSSSSKMLLDYEFSSCFLHGDVFIEFLWKNIRRATYLFRFHHSHRISSLQIRKNVEMRIVEKLRKFSKSVLCSINFTHSPICSSRGKVK